ncbi:SH3 domain-containing protein [Streptomyces roseirectus]|uniref:SH3 domain-containing protein n=2 Tax=Streptomyces roseirectus TaxID=2768066 RepID=A0A7H0ISU1_9ACTN|nr:SH3 domain-containing protein [Streptomyces roseirectus]
MLAAAVLISGLALGAGPLAQGAQAVEGARVAQGAQAAQGARAFVCVVNDDGVNFRGGPGTEYAVLGQVNRGQQFEYLDQVGDWVKGNLVGGRTGVWIHYSYVNC